MECGGLVLFARSQKTQFELSLRLRLWGLRRSKASIVSRLRHPFSGHGEGSMQQRNVRECLWEIPYLTLAYRVIFLSKKPDLVRQVHKSSE